MSEQTKDLRNTGHGWVTERPDGMKAKCGGPGLCVACKAENDAVKPPAVGGEPPIVGKLVPNGGGYDCWHPKANQGQAVILLDDHQDYVARLQAEVTALNAQLTAANAAYQDQAEELSELQAEVERLNARELGVKHEVFDIVSKECDKAKARNAELEGLLRDAIGEIDFYRGEKHACKGLDMDVARAALAEGKEHE